MSVMPKTLVPQPVIPPSRCLACARHAGAMVDLAIRPDDPAFSPYLCLFCVYECGRLVGGLDPSQADALREEVEQLTAQVAALEAQLAWEREHKTIGLEEARVLLHTELKTPSPIPTFDGPSLDDWKKKIRTTVKETQDRTNEFKRTARQCSALRKDGKQCTGIAVGDGELCIAHIKEQRRAERLARAREKLEQIGAGAE